MPEAARPPFDPAAVARDAREHGLVVVAGAGLSMGPPSSLPGWTLINDAFLESLAMCLALHTDGEVGYVPGGDSSGPPRTSIRGVSSTPNSNSARALALGISPAGRKSITSTRIVP